jgi:hypothetical protein
MGPVVEPIIDREDYGKMIGRLPFGNVRHGWGVFFWQALPPAAGKRNQVLLERIPGEGGVISKSPIRKY